MCYGTTLPYSLAHFPEKFYPSMCALYVVSFSFSLTSQLTCLFTLPCQLHHSGLHNIVCFCTFWSAHLITVRSIECLLVFDNFYPDLEWPRNDGCLAYHSNGHSVSIVPLLGFWNSFWAISPTLHLPWLLCLALDDGFGTFGLVFLFCRVAHLRGNIRQEGEDGTV